MQIFKGLALGVILSLFCAFVLLDTAHARWGNAQHPAI